MRRVIREAQLIVRGSASTMDWAINFEETMCPYLYTFLQPDSDPSDDNGTISLLLCVRSY